MAIEKKTIRLLILEDSQNEADAWSVCSAMPATRPAYID